MTHSPLSTGIRLTSDHSSRNGVRPCTIILHHAATASLNAILDLFQPGGRTVSANYAIKDREIIVAVDEDRRPWTSSSEYDDGRAITAEIANSRTGDPWPVSDATFDTVARWIADVSARYGFDINDATILTHQELYSKFGRSYPTACPGDLQRRKGELLTRARDYRYRGTPAENVPVVVPTPKEEEEMALRVVPTPTSGIHLVSLITGKRVHIKNTAHLGLIQRVIGNDADDNMLPAEIDLVGGYIAAVNPAPTATVDYDALAKKLAEIDVELDASTVRKAVREALAETVGTVDLKPRA